MRKYFVVQGCHEIKKIFEINGKSYISTGTKTLKIKDNTHTNTFMVHNLPIQKIFSIESVDCHEIYCGMIPISLGNFENGLDLQHLTKDEVSNFESKYYLFNHLDLHYRINIDDIIKIIQYLQTFSSFDNFDFDFQLQSIYLKKFAKMHFIDGKNKIEEYLNVNLLFFYLLKYPVLNDLYFEWKNANLFLDFQIEPNMNLILSFISESFIDEKAKHKIRENLSKLKDM